MNIKSAYSVACNKNANVAQPQLRWEFGSVELWEFNNKTPEKYVGNYVSHGLLCVLKGLAPTSERRMDGKRAPRPPSRAGETNFFPAGSTVCGVVRGNLRCLGVNFNPGAEEILLGARGPSASFTPKINVFDSITTNLAQELERQIVTEEVDAIFVEAAATLLLARVGRLSESNASIIHRRKLSGPQLNEVMDRIEDNLQRPITLLELAAPLGMSLAHFSKLFRNATGRPPHKYLIERRVERARTLLEDEELTISEIAHEVGFNSQSHLTTQFKRVLGLTPARYRWETR